MMALKPFKMLKKEQELKNEGKCFKDREKIVLVIPREYIYKARKYF